jgi:predicted SnoaL-like aldol condensation-catalyzing enzyme
MKTNINSINKSLVLEFWKKAIGERDLDVADKLISETYIQHSRNAKPGKAGLMEALTQLKKMSVPQTDAKPLMRVIADGDFVAVHMLIEFGGKKMIVLDLVRIEDNQFAEHWDAIEPVPESVQNAQTLTDGPIQIEDEELTDSNRTVVDNYRESILEGRRFDDLNDFLVPHVIHHNPAITGLQIVEAGLIIAEGNFVMTQTKIKIGDVSNIVYDIYRLKHGKIREHWQVKTPI